MIYRVSSDFIGETLSTVVPLDTIQVIDKNIWEKFFLGMIMSGDTQQDW